MGRYVVESRLGAGGMAEVFVARQVGAEGFSRRVALKRMAAALSQDEQFAEMFVAEARIASLLTHPNIVAVQDFDRDDDGSLFLAMELVDGADLRRVAAAAERRGERLLPPLVAFVIGEVLRALAFAHELRQAGRPLGIVHRDVSPHNVLVSRTGAVKLADFGIAKATAVSGVSRSTSIRGKVAFMSPEQARGEALDGRSDLFATGVMLYELLSGSRPFEGSTEAEILARLLTGRFVPLPDAAPSAPRDLVAIGTRLLAADRGARYASAADALRDVLACTCYPSDGPGELARFVGRVLPPEAEALPVPPADSSGYAGESRGSRGWEPSRRTLGVLALGALVSVAAVVVVWLPRAPRRAQPTPPPAATAPVIAQPPTAGADAAPIAAMSPTVDAGPPAPDATTDRPRGRSRGKKRGGPDWNVDLGGRSPDEVPVEE